MPPRRGSGNSRSRAGKFRIPVAGLLLVSVVTPLVFLAARLCNFAFSVASAKYSSASFTNNGVDGRKLNALQQIESLFSKDVLDVIIAKTDDSGPLSLNVIGRKDLSSSWIIEKQVELNNTKANVEAKEHGVVSSSKREALYAHKEEETYTGQAVELDKNEGEQSLSEGLEQNSTERSNTDERMARLQKRLERKHKRVSELTQTDDGDSSSIVKEVSQRSKEIDDNVLNKYSIWRPEFELDSDTLVRIMRDQLIMARIYASLAHSQNLIDLQHELNTRIKESRRAMGEAKLDVDLPRSASEKMKAMGQTLFTARAHLYDCKAVTKKLRAMLQASEDQANALLKQSTILRQLIAKTMPKGLHCLSILLTSEFNALSSDQKAYMSREKLEDPSLFHYALFSDNVIAAAVVVNSTVQNAKEPEKHVFHLVSDKLNFAAMKMWFIANPPGNATIYVENIDDFKWLNSTYCPVLRQLESRAMKEYYFKSDNSATLADASANLKYRNPKYLSMLNHLRFYLPEVYPKLDKILFLDDDIVVQKDLTSLWSLDLHGHVNGAVETCGESFHRFDKYLNFSNPLISDNFSPNACGWAYGMNIFDLREWKQRDITSIYHRWQNLNEQRELWKLGTLPPGLITFYNLTFPLDKSWHVLGLGYDPHVERHDIEHAAVVHYNGNMKPWLDLSMSRYKSYWTKYVDFGNFFVQQCNINV